jgi:hypothetical protein
VADALAGVERRGGSRDGQLGNRRFAASPRYKVNRRSEAVFGVIRRRPLALSGAECQQDVSRRCLGERPKADRRRSVPMTM